VALHFAECCSPIPGDRIIGVQTPGKGVVIHTIDCERLATLEDDGRDEWVDLAWTPTALNRALGHRPHRSSRLRTSAAFWRSCAASSRKTRATFSICGLAKRTADFFDMIFDIEVADARHLTNILAALRASRSVKEVDRVKG
jgi:guanosine-3',5'-bis(diphosphate) 3'-pyrophosphohydrolase